jgi:hypothetical protein
MSDFGESVPIISTINDRQNSTDKLSPEVKLIEYMADGEMPVSDILNDGYSEQFNEWRLIIKFTGDIENFSKRYGINASDLGYGYALAYVKTEVLPMLERDADVVYVDKPKRLFFD